MPRPTKLSGPIGRGWIKEEQTPDGTFFVAYWQKYVPDPTSPLGKKKAWGGRYVIGKKIKHKGTDGFASESKALDYWKTICDRVMNGASADDPEDSPKVTSSGKFTFQRYCEEVWVPAKCLSRWNEETADLNVNYYLKNFIYPKFGDRLLDALNLVELQEYLDFLAKKGRDPEKEIGYSKTVVEHIKFYLDQPLEHAKNTGVIKLNPAAQLDMPKIPRRVNRPALRLKQMIVLSKVMPTPKDQIMLEVLFFGALRRGELFALRWKSLKGTVLTIAEQHRPRRKGNSLKPPKHRHHGESDPVQIPTKLAERIQDYKVWCGNVTAEDFIFPSKRNTPIHQKNWMDRVLKPAAEKAELEKIDYQMFRRGMATMMRKTARARAREEDPKIQGHLRHHDVETTRENYIQDDDEEEASIRQIELDAMYELYRRGVVAGASAAA